MTKFKHSKLALEYLTGMRGLEIGGSAHNPFGLDTRNVDYTDDMDTVFKKEEKQLCGEALAVDIVAEGDQLPVEDKSVDFVINSHVVEHFFDPIKAIKEWLRVSKYYVFMVVPHRDRTFDKNRPLTTIQELEDRHAGKLTPTTPGDSKYGNNMRGHWTVWNAQTFVEMCSHFGFKVEKVQDPDDKVGNGFIVILKAN